MYTVYGIPNCDSVKKALKWLGQNQLAVSFHDYKKEGIDKPRLERWINQQGLEKVLNAKSTTWRELSREEQEKAKDIDFAVALMIQKPSLIKRPIIEHKGKILTLGFNESFYETAFKGQLEG